MIHLEIEWQILREWWWKFANTLSNDKIIEDIINRYNEEHRYYHDLWHIDMCLKEIPLHTCQKRFSVYTEYHENICKLYLALLTHDVIYDPKKPDTENVTSSAVYGKNMCLDLGFDSDFAKDVHSLIMITDYSKPPPKSITELEKIIYDTDLKIFGQPEPIFDLYEINIRKEYDWVPYEEYRVKRAEILEGFLARESVYQREDFRKMYEEQARKNLERSIKRLLG